MTFYAQSRAFLRRKSLKTKSSSLDPVLLALNKHTEECTPYAPGACCRIARIFKTKYPEHHAILKGMYAEAGVKSTLPAKKRPAKKRSTSARKPAKKERGIRSDSGIERLSLSAELTALLRKRKILTIGKLLSMRPLELERAGVSRETLKTIARALSRFDRKLSD